MLSEHFWSELFPETAPDIPFYVLNISAMSNLRADAHLPGDCLHFCLPGVPDVWVGMMLSLAQQIASAAVPHSL